MLLKKLITRANSLLNLNGLVARSVLSRYYPDATAVGALDSLPALFWPSPPARPWRRSARGRVSGAKMVARAM